jgi:hypothetical protein
MLYQRIAERKPPELPMPRHKTISSVRTIIRRRLHFRFTPELWDATSSPLAERRAHRHSLSLNERGR